MYAMGIGNDLLTPYAAALILDLYKTSSGGYEVDVLYRNATNMVTPFVMQVPGCPANGGCPLNIFAARMQPQMVTSRREFDRLCKSNQLTTSLSSGAASRNILVDIIMYITRSLYDLSHPPPSP